MAYCTRANRGHTGHSRRTRVTATSAEQRHPTVVSRNLSSPHLALDLLLFLCAVVCGTTTAVVSQRVLLHVVSPAAAVNVSLALSATCSAAAHGWLVHRKPVGELLSRVVAGTPVAYAAMRAIHLVAGF